MKKDKGKKTLFVEREKVDGEIYGRYRASMKGDKAPKLEVVFREGEQFSRFDLTHRDVRALRALLDEYLNKVDDMRVVDGYRIEDDPVDVLDRGWDPWE